MVQNIESISPEDHSAHRLESARILFELAQFLGQAFPALDSHGPQPGLTNQNETKYRVITSISTFLEIGLL